MEKQYRKAKEVAQQIAGVMQSKKTGNEETLKEWVLMNSSAEGVINTFTDETELTKAVASFDRSEICDYSAEKLVRKIKTSRQKRRKRIYLYNSVAAAMIAVSMLVWNYFEKDETNNISESHLLAKTAPMNVAVPTLILKNGEKINLNDSLNNHSQTIVREKILGIEYLKILDEAVTTDSNTLIIPSKYIYPVILSDGTKVMLNANSKLVYPVKFNNEKREVILEGEAFFEVTKSDIPFIVQSNGVSVRVYGTKFNVNSYHSSSVETVLVSGSVGVSIGNIECMLKPNQLSNINVDSGRNDVSDVDVNEYLAWMKGDIKSYDANLGSLIEKLSSWYGEDFTFFHENKWNIPVTASFKQTQSIDEIISAIEYAAKVKFEKTKGGYIIY